MYDESDSVRAGASVLIVGLGALGSAAASLLADTGLARLLLVDDDRVELSNLQRQVLFSEADIGSSKVEAARERLGADCETFHARLDTSNASALFGRADFIIDATDDPETKWLINRTALATGKPYCHAGVVGGRGQLMAVVPGRSACLECVFGSFGDLTGNAGCAELGVLAPVAGLIGTLEALTATAYLTGDQAFRAGRMLTYELPAGRWRHVDFERVDGCVCRHRRQ